MGSLILLAGGARDDAPRPSADQRLGASRNVARELPVVGGNVVRLNRIRQREREGSPRLVHLATEHVHNAVEHHHGGVGVRHRDRHVAQLPPRAIARLVAVAVSEIVPVCVAPASPLPASSDRDEIPLLSAKQEEFTVDCGAASMHRGQGHRRLLPPFQLHGLAVLHGETPVVSRRRKPVRLRPADEVQTVTQQLHGSGVAWSRQVGETPPPPGDGVVGETVRDRGSAVGAQLTGEHIQKPHVVRADRSVGFGHPWWQRWARSPSARPEVEHEQPSIDNGLRLEAADDIKPIANLSAPCIEQRPGAGLASSPISLQWACGWDAELPLHYHSPKAQDERS